MALMVIGSSTLEFSSENQLRHAWNVPGSMFDTSNRDGSKGRGMVELPQPATLNPKSCPSKHGSCGGSRSRQGGSGGGGE